MEAKIRPARQVNAEARAAHRRWLLQSADAQHTHDGEEVPRGSSFRLIAEANDKMALFPAIKKISKP